MEQCFLLVLCLILTFMFGLCNRRQHVCSACFYVMVLLSEYDEISQLQVRISEGASLYALCRSWLRNGLPDENQVCFPPSIYATYIYWNKDTTV